MKITNKYIIILFIFSFACKAKENENTLESKQYNNSKLLENRKDIKDFFLNSKESPIAKLENKNNFQFSFFSPKAEFCVKSKLVEFNKKDTVTLLTSKENKVRRYIKFGFFDFKIQNKSFKLIAYLIPEHKESLFVPFIDETSGYETYGAGRYLDIEFNSKSEYYIDFNLAYSPYCAYNKSYSCPLVPKENILKIKIEAGEKLHRFIQK